MLWRNLVFDILIFLRLSSNRFEFETTSRAKMGEISKLLFAFKGKARQSFVLFFYLFDLLKGPLIILLGLNGF